jgi:hypothetical protein
MFRPLYWAIIRSTVFQRRLYSVVFTYVISPNEISLLTWPKIIVEKPSIIKGKSESKSKNQIITLKKSKSQKSKFCDFDFLSVMI